MQKKLVDECTETVEEVKLALSENENSYKCIFCYFGYFLQLTLAE